MQIGYGQAQETEGRCDNSISPEQNCGLHPLIHSFSRESLAQNVGCALK